MMVWVTRHCLSYGIYQAEVGEPDKRGYVTIKSEITGFRNQYLKMHTDCFEDKEVAIQVADGLRSARITTLQRQIDKLIEKVFE